MRQDLRMHDSPVTHIMAFHQQLNYFDIPVLIYYTVATSPLHYLHLYFSREIL